MMNKYRIMFSPTGGTEKVSKSITKNWGYVEDIAPMTSNPAIRA